MDDKAEFLVLALTERCNLRCVYCYAAASATGADMDPDIAALALDRLGPPPGRRQTVEFSGGEPLLRFELLKELVLTRASAQRRFALQTNGVALTEDKLAFLVDNGVGLGVSLDGPPETNRQTRGDAGGAMRALRLIDEAGVGVNVTVVLTRHNVERLPRFLLTLASLKSPRVINLDLVRPVGRASGGGLAPRPEQIKGMVPAMLSATAFIAQRRFPPLKVREVDQVRRRAKLGLCEPYCLGAAGSYAAVTPDGRVYPCASLADDDGYLAGRVDRPEPIRVANLVRGWGLPPACGDCPARFVCRGGCPSRRISAAGSPTRPHGLECLLRKEIFRRVNQ